MEETESTCRKERLAHNLHEAAHYLPAQGPIGVFIHHNTLHAFQHLPFEQAVEQAARLFGAEPYLSEDAYREAFEAGRIRPQDIDFAIDNEGGDRRLHRLMLMPGLRKFLPETIVWEIEEHGLTERFRHDLPTAARRALAGDSPQDLFNLCLSRIPQEEEGAAGSQSPPAARVRDGVLAASGVDLDDTVQPLLIKLCSSFLDQGLAYWPMPHRDRGFWNCTLDLLDQPLTFFPDSLDALTDLLPEFRRLPATEAVLHMLDLLGVEAGQQVPYLKAELLALPGWAGMMYLLESDASLAPHQRVPAKLMDFVAVRLLLTLAAASRFLPDTSSWRLQLRPPAASRHTRRLAAAATLFDAAQLMGLGAGTPPEVLDHLRSEIESFPEWERRRVLHLAYEHRHERQILLPLREHVSHGLLPPPERPAAQVFFCLDDREESIRRHLEEVDPEIETLGAAGFFGVAMNYAGIDDARGVAMCPVVVKPQHAVVERPMEDDHDSYLRRKILRRFWASGSRHAFLSTRTLVRGWLGSTVLGLFSILPLAARVLSPRRYGRLMEWLNALILPEPRTELAFVRGDQPAEGMMRGFTVEEKVDRVAAVLEPAGLRQGMARLVVIIGHGSTSLNNPHESAYDCGACGGRKGGPNARIFAAMANRPEVRRILRERGIVIPEDTWFAGGYHDTCNDNIEYFDLGMMPESHRPDFDRLRGSMDMARARSAHERTRRFEWADDELDIDDGLLYVQERAEHLAEPRPEYGHSTNAVCHVGRRSTTRGLFLDRRAFLASYDANQDPDDSNLARLLAAVVPVCAGISLEYYFSRVDNEFYGCGTKLPHNVTGLVGVMNGYESDLRTGLTWQMVEIHEPVRILFIVESTPKRVLETIRRNPVTWEFLNNRWIRLAVQDPADGSIIHVYRGEGNWDRIQGSDERLAVADSSPGWYRARSEHLPLARIERKGGGR